jgi:hypothetical protein
MPFRLLNPVAAQCESSVVVRRRSRISTVLQRFEDASVPQCEGITRAGRRCTVTAKSDFRDSVGRLVAGPLRQGSRVCLLHLELFCTEHVSAPEDFLVFFLDLETSGLNVLHDEVLEIALTADPSGAQFATTVLPRRLPEGLGVHGIGHDELLSGVPFPCAFQRMIAFVQDVVLDALFNAGTVKKIDFQYNDWKSTPRCVSGMLSGYLVLLVSHNGFKFDFPMLISECYRHRCDLSQLTEFCFCDTLPLTRAFSATIGDACARLQCLARCCRCGTGRQHRALEDTIVLRSVMQHCADYSGVPIRTLLSYFVYRFDAQATLAAHRVGLDN